MVFDNANFNLWYLFGNSRRVCIVGNESVIEIMLLLSGFEELVVKV